MQLETLKMFCDLVETKSFTKAAQMNQVTQSAVSQQVSAMEQRFHSLLIERSKKQFRVTREGQAVYDYSKPILRTYAELHSRLADLKDQISGTIRMAVIYTVGLYDLPPYLKKYLQRFPAVNVHVEYRHSKQIHEDVLSNVVDLGLVAYPGNSPKLKVVPLRRDKLVLICHPEHPFAASKTVKLRNLSGQKFVGFSVGVPLRKALDRIFRERQVQARNVMEFDNIDTLKRAVEIDAGISIVPENTVVQEVASGSLARIEIADGEFFRPVGIIHRTDRVLTPAMKEFISVLKGAE
jgi:DNA-binding transcriptional LysR family regulator